MAETCDVVVIGSGHNGLVAAAYLARAGLSVEVLERNPVAGGAVASEELTEPGFVHDTFSSWHPLFKLSAAFAELGEELGIEYCETPEATAANLRTDGSVTIAYRDAERTTESFDPRDRAPYLKEMESFGETIPTVGQLFGVELFSGSAPKLSAQLARQLGLRRGLRFAGDLVSSARGWFETRFTGREVSDLYSAWALHTGLPPDAAGSGFQTLAIAGSLHAVGLPVVRGGARNFVAAFERLIAGHGGRIRTGTEVERILTRGTSAVGVVAGGTEIHARRAVIANTTPTQLYGRLLPHGVAPPQAVEQGQRYRYSPRGGMQIHLALNEPLRWRDPRLNAVPIVHISDGVGDVSLACAQAAAGLLPARPTVVVGQQSTIDPTRVPAGAATLWIQLQQVPYAPTGDAAGEIDVAPGWDGGLAEAYIERVLSRFEPHVENWPAARRAIAALPPTEIERRNPNLVRGDIYSGDCELGQSYLWRPLPGYGAHSTPVANLYQCGASTYPGPGLNAASGRIVALKIIGGAGRLAKARRLLRAGR